MKVLVIGGGAAGMMAAVAAADRGAGVILLEKNEKLGKKIYITGKGRCNLTNNCPVEEFFDHIVANPRFLYSAVYSFDQQAMCSFLEAEGLALKEERGQRVFPQSDKSSDVIRTLEKALQKRNVEIRLHTEVQSLVIQDGRFVKARLRGKPDLAADAVIVATGGLSYRSTGSTGDGYRFAEETGHRVTPRYPSLVPLKVREPFVRELEGLSLRNVSLKMDVFEEFGEMLFTADGISGPLVLSASSMLCRQIAEHPEGIGAQIDLKPALDWQQLDARILKDFAEVSNRDFRNSLKKLLPSSLIPVVVRLSGISPYKKVNEITKEERKSLLRTVKEFPLTVTGTAGYEQAVITRGGVNVKDVDPSTMRSRRTDNLYFAGEVLDTDGYTGGFNLQIAWSTGHLAGESAAEHPAGESAAGQS